MAGTNAEAPVALAVEAAAGADKGSGGDNVAAAADLSPRQSAQVQGWPPLVRRRNLAYGLNMDGLGIGSPPDRAAVSAVRSGPA